MKLLVSIATYKRPHKLARLLKSLYNQTYHSFDIFVVYDNNDIESFHTISLLSNEKYEFIHHVLTSHGYVIGCWNYSHELARTEGYDANLTLCDDVELRPDCIEKLVDCMQNSFPDLDGVIGVSQTCNNNGRFNPAGQVLIGAKFAERYKPVNYAICCPDYIQWFQDNELLSYAFSNNKFLLCKEGILNHYHPLYYPNEMDATHGIVRGDIYRKDRDTFHRRKDERLLWGDSWARING